MNPLRISVIGGGYWGKKVVREILDIGRTTREVELKSLVDTSPASLAACREEFGGSIEYGWDYQSLATDTSLSGDHIATPNSTHFELASHLLRQGKIVPEQSPI